MTTAARPYRAPNDRRIALAVVVVVAALAASGASMSLARFGGSDSNTGAFTTDVLTPPTSLGAAGGTTVTLTWMATSKAWANGYTVWRSTTSGGTYSQIASVTPRTTVSYVDSPAAGTYYYKVRAVYQSWSSTFAGPVSATVSTQASTGYKHCVGASNAADTTGAGDNDGYETNPGNACGLDNAFAVDASSGSGGTQSCGTGATPDANKDRHRYWGFALGLPGSVTSIDGIQVQAVLKFSNNGGTSNICAQLSWDGGATWTTISSQAVSGGNNLTTYTFGATNDRWGHSPWTTAQLDTANFRVRLIDASTMSNKDYSLDAVTVQVTYTP